MSNLRSLLHTGIFGLILGMAVAPSWAQPSVSRSSLGRNERSA